MEAVQDLIHKMEVGAGRRWLRVVVVAVALLSLMAGYNWRAFRNMNAQEAMDAAQLGRNIAEGKGYTTLFIRPFSVFLIKNRSLAAHGERGDPAKIKGMHPDIANPPVYPVVLAALMKVLPFNYSAQITKGFWTTDGRFSRSQPDFLIGLFNQLILLAVAVMVYFLARRLFDRTVAWFSALCFFGTELMWRFSISGLSTMLLLLIFLGLAWCLTRFEEEAREPGAGPLALLGWAVLAGALTGLGALTRYSFGWLIVPVLGFLILFGGSKRLGLAGLALAAFALLLLPWTLRNWSLSGTPFGTAGYAVLETWGFPENRLQRSIEPSLPHLTITLLGSLVSKLLANLRQMVQNDLPKLGGSWITAFFLAGLLVVYRNLAVRRLRYFVLSSLFVLAIVQALGHTQLSEDVPELNSENLLVLLTPLVLIYGVSLFFLLLEQIHLPLRELRHIITGGFVVLACLPMIFVFLPPAQHSAVAAPYYPPAIQSAARWTSAGQLTMSDIPWAVAWYGRSQSIWVTLDAEAEFLAVNDYLKPVQTLYLSETTMNAKFLTQWYLPGETGWGNLMFAAMSVLGHEAGHWPKHVDLVVRQPLGSPIIFPLHYWQTGFPYQFLLTATENMPKGPGQ